MSSLLLISFWVLASVVIILSAVIFRAGPRLPQIFEDFLLYGKIRSRQRTWSVIQNLEIPKRWFLHFYVTGVVVNSGALIVVTMAYLHKSSLPVYVERALNNLTTNKQVSIDSHSAVLLIALMLFQNVRRLIECLIISIYSRGTMNVMHYLLGIILYSTFFLAVLVEAPDPRHEHEFPSLRGIIQWHHLVGLTLFIWASWHHNRIHIAFAKLRKNDKGTVVSDQHYVPRGGWFELISCPHYFMEILIYIAFAVIGGVGSHMTVLSIVMFVVANQLVAGYLTHCWYHEHFKAAYPAQRAAIIPYLF